MAVRLRISLLLTLAALAAAALACGCQPTVVVQHKVDPIYITIDINLKVDQELDEFFAFEEELEDEATDETEEIDVEDVEVGASGGDGAENEGGQS